MVDRYSLSWLMMAQADAVLWRFVAWWCGVVVVAWRRGIVAVWRRSVAACGGAALWWCGVAWRGVHAVGRDSGGGVESRME